MADGSFALIQSSESEPDGQYVQQLAELGWTAEQIARNLGVSDEVFALDYQPFFDAGVAALKTLPEKRLSWRPTPADLEKVRTHAAKGLTEIAVASKLKVPREVFLRRLGDTPQLRDAFDQGNGEYHAKRIEEFNHMVDINDSALKYMGPAYMFIQKTGGMSDKPEAAPKQVVQVEGTVKHQHVLNAPPTVPINNIAQYAKIEMERATAISAEKLKLSQPEAVDAEVVDGG